MLVLAAFVRSDHAHTNLAGRGGRPFGLDLGGAAAVSRPDHPDVRLKRIVGIARLILVSIANLRHVSINYYL